MANHHVLAEDGVTWRLLAPPSGWQPPAETPTHRIGDFVNGHGLTSRGWILGHAETPDGKLLKVGEVHKGWKLTDQGWRPAKAWEKFLNGTWFFIGG